MTDMLDLDYTFDDLDTSWLQEFEKLDNENKNYINEDLLFIKINYIYVNSKKEITNLYEEKHIFKTPNILLKEDLIGLIKRNSFVNQTKYSLLSILKYNINIEAKNLKTFFRMKNNIIGDAYLHSIKNITNIHFDKTISVFQDLNSLIIIFFEKDNTNGLITNMNNSTRRIYINHFKNNINKKTKRNLFKDIT
uniref:Uncharacterized protein n=1 Tax=viral metagenome TaxID=1070528 RepID=A0A6C0I7I5_9ZZZZ